MTAASTLPVAGHDAAQRRGPATHPRTGRLTAMAKLRLFASAREAAGTGTDAFDGATVADVLAAATHCAQGPYPVDAQLRAGHTVTRTTGRG